MEYLNGEMLGSFLKHSKWANKLEDQKRSALYFMHQSGVISDRENIMVINSNGKEPYLKLINFGTLARR